jgi:hypothetical protein
MSITFKCFVRPRNSKRNSLIPDVLSIGYNLPKNRNNSKFDEKEGYPLKGGKGNGGAEQRGERERGRG